jgi:hypothetical protein
MLVSIDHVRPVRCEPLRHSRFARADPADEADDGHEEVVVRRRVDCKVVGRLTSDKKPRTEVRGHRVVGRSRISMAR